jgi:hypothetical protein
VEAAHAHSSHTCGPTGPGSVLLELGEHTGALILEVPPALAGHEIEISPSGGGPRTHSLVRERRTAAGVSYAAVYPNLPAADYVIWRDALTPAATVRVTSARPTTYRWP